MGTINTGLNAGKPDFNISQMDFKESKLDADEADLPMSEFAQAIYMGIKMVLKAKPHLNQHVLLWSLGLRKQLMGIMLLLI